MGKKVCNNCHIAFDSRLRECPECHQIIDENKQFASIQEGTGRKAGAGGEACNYCPHCYGNSDWCPIMDGD